MRKILFILLFLLSTSSAQNSLAEKINAGIQVEYVNIGGDLGKYWGNTISGGVFLQYSLMDNFGYEMSLNLSQLSEGKLKSQELPGILMITIPVGGVINFPLSNKFDINTFIGIENVMMIFDESELQKSNLDESEFGIVLSVGLTYKPFELEVFTKFKNMFSAPDNTPFYSVGFRKRLF